MDRIEKSLNTLLDLSSEDAIETKTLQSRIEEQSNLIAVFKHKADELFQRCQTLEKVNTELEDKMTNYQEEQDSRTNKEKLLEKRFALLAANTQSIISFMNEYKEENVKLKTENKHLHSENEMLFSKKLREKEESVQRLAEDIKVLTENYTSKEKAYQEQLAEHQSKLEEATQRQVEDTSLLDQLQQQQREAVEMSRDLKLKLEKAEEKFALKETDMKKTIACLTEEKGKLSTVSKAKHEELQQLKKKWKNIAEAKDRDEDIVVSSLQCALNESTNKYERLAKDFEAYKEYSANLLKQERELNKKLRQLTG